MGKAASWNAFLFVAEDRGLMFVFRLSGSEPERSMKLKGLEPSASYELRYEDSGRVGAASGESLMQEGLIFNGLEKESSEVIRLARL